MNKFFKVTIICAILSILFLIVYGAVKAINGNYFVYNPFNGIFIVLLVGVAIYATFSGIRAIWMYSILFLVFPLLQGCQYAKSNQQVVLSDDCGMTWKKLNAGEAVPTGGANHCYMKVVMPNYSMQGESQFISNLKERVRVVVHIDYDYTITDPLSFIKQAKYLGKANADVDSDGALNPSAFEGAENMVIDKRIKDISKGLFITEDIVELDQAELETKLLTNCNKILDPLGVQLNFITLTFDLDDQTRQAIDVSTAMKIYESKGLIDVGRQVIIQRAGATKIVVENKVETPVVK
jgi:hypothetical protein